MSIVYIKGNLAKIERALKEEPKVAKLAAVSALNKTVAKAQTQGIKQLSALKKVPSTAIRTRVKIGKASFRRMYATIIILIAGYPIDRLKYRQLGLGRKVGRGFSAAGRKFPHAFFGYRGADSRGTSKQQELIFERRGKARLPIDRVKIDLQPEADTIFRIAINKAALADLPRIFDSELRFRRAK